MLRETSLGAAPDTKVRGATFAPAAPEKQIGVAAIVLCRGEKEMKIRSPVEICAPSDIFALACVLSIPTCIIAVIWMTVGVCCLGYRSLDQFPAAGIPRRWRYGIRGALLHFWHLAWWPWYVRDELRQCARHAQRIFMHRGPENTREASGHNGSDDRTDRP
ncbi:hypothetical protein [Paraburkholderia bannensis]|uniref:hypothetical protein n=1 Tax=Paraburkholderia bannensis TaxID=765414 RepID=UPI002AB716EF|nr:hypothetical protein [Paraburkholderia bannensis]